MHNSMNRLMPYVFRFVPAFVACFQPSSGEGETKDQLSDRSKKEKISKKIKPKKMLKNILHHRNEDKKIKNSTIKDHPTQDQENNPMKETSVKYGKFLIFECILSVVIYGDSCECLHVSNSPVYSSNFCF